jgi:hypothetical protein
MLLTGFFFALQLSAVLFAVPTAAVPQLNANSACNEYMTFCWYGDEVDAWGTVWKTDDPSEKSLEQVTQVRCFQKLHVCMKARNQKVPLGWTVTNIDLYNVRSWDTNEIRAVLDESADSQCEQDTLLLNRVEQKAIIIDSPGPQGSEKRCIRLVGQPKTVIYRLTYPEMDRTATILKGKAK